MQRVARLSLNKTHDGAPAPELVSISDGDSCLAGTLTPPRKSIRISCHLWTRALVRQQVPSSTGLRDKTMARPKNLSPLLYPLARRRLAPHFRRTADPPSISKPVL
ncbi:hypothetical protein PVAP13_9NG499400 [Panicum virgatum]|uniref:Uncharacterized protein n=1 Tax=Panicum virgatum TaxID=38727 RepID=A0A8T0MUN5_PANVG|nr:hypothetical protein PVAP13_9NG499400 [Panicum virgatum]